MELTSYFDYLSSQNKTNDQQSTDVDNTIDDLVLNPYKSKNVLEEFVKLKKVTTVLPLLAYTLAAAVVTFAIAIVIVVP
jgi:hypothetical protein